MAGLIVLGLAGAYVALFWLLTAKAKGWGKRVGVLGVAVAIPFWELPLGYLTYRASCAKDAGIEIFQKFGPAKSVLFFGNAGGSTPEEAGRYGISTVEYGTPGSILRISSDQGRSTRSQHESPASSVMIERAPRQSVDSSIERTVYLVRRTVDGQVIAQQIYYHWRGLWWQIAGAPMFGAGSNCYGNADEPLIALVARGTH